MTSKATVMNFDELWLKNEIVERPTGLGFASPSFGSQP